MRNYSWMIGLLGLPMAFSHATPWVLNNPYPAKQAQEKIYYTSFSEQPKTLDPAQSYSANEYGFIAQIYEPLLQYDYLKRPYTLVPLTASQMPDIQYFDKNNHRLPDEQAINADHTVYTLSIKPGIIYQPHPAFAKDEHGHYRYTHLSPNYLDKHHIKQLSDFPYTGTRPLIADDYIYQIKRLADPAVSSPIYGFMSDYIQGFKAYGATLPKQRGAGGYLDLRQYPLAGIKKIDDLTFQIIINGAYPQFLYWLAMPFFSPVPWEADRFYFEPDMDDRNLSFDWYPVGTGPFMLSENNPNGQMILDKNPNYREDYFDELGTPLDAKKGYLAHVGERLPLIDKAIFSLEKESIPRWTKFMQGYYDQSGVGSDSFDQAIQITSKGTPILTPLMESKGIRLKEMTDLSIFYLGFNMRDSIVGGKSESARKLRQAISIAVNYDEYITIFFNGRGRAAQGPLPPGIMGYLGGARGINPYVYTWNGNKPERLSIEVAKRLMNEAGYPNGRDPATKMPLIIHYDVPASGGPDEKELLNWMQKQFAKIGISLSIRATDYNRFQEKMRAGNTQVFSWGWNADYPDPENFLFLFYGPNSQVLHGGENAANYNNPKFDRLFKIMKTTADPVQRTQLIEEMVELLRHDAPWVWGVNSESLILSQSWMSPIKANNIALNTLKYVAIDIDERNRLRARWNQPIFWPIGVLIVVLLLLLLPFLIAYHKNQWLSAERVKS